MPIRFDKARWRVLQSVLDEVLDLPESEQLSRLEQRCAGDFELYDDVLLLLHQSGDDLTFLERPAIGMIGGAASHHAVEPNSKVGNYRLCEKIGHGGMGVVYRAERIAGDFEQQVAIKLLLNWHTGASGLQRFKREQRLLAKFEHPSIARLLDGGVTDHAQPYLVMELVAGTPINEFCASNRLDLNQRLALLLQLCAALGHAHRHLIVHRDVKPSNILVTAEQQIKLLDFGVAKLIGDDNDLQLTRTHDYVMTPSFASPEQLRNQVVTVATDIYQVGLLAYEMLCGRQPFQDQADDFATLVKLICEHDATPPSRALSRCDQAEQQRISSERRTEPRALNRRLSGELDAIIGKMLATDPSQRYSSMESVTADIEAFTNHQPVSAVSQNLVYRGRKMMRRYWRAAAVTGLFIGMLTLYAITTTLQSARIQTALETSLTEQRKAQRVADFMVDIFKAADPNAAGLQTLTAQNLLERGEQQLTAELSLDPAVHGHMLTSLGEIYYSQGEAETSTRLLSAALEKQRESMPGNDLGLAATLTQLAIVHSNTNDLTRAQQLFSESESLYLRSSASATLDQNRDYAELLNAFGILKLKRGDLPGAEQYLQQAIAILRQQSHVANDELAVALNNMAHYQTITGQLAAARQSLSEAIRIHEQTLGERHSYFSVYLNNYGNLLTKLEDFDAAAPIFERALTLQRDLLGDAHPYLLITLRNLGTLAYERGEPEKALTYLSQAVDIQAALALPDKLMSAILNKQQGEVYSALNRHTDAGLRFAAMRRDYQTLDVGDHLVAMGLCALAQHQYFQGDFVDALATYQQAAALLSPASLQHSVALLGIARAHLRLGAIQQAADTAREAARIRADALNQHHSLRAEVDVLLAVIKLTQQDSTNRGTTDYATLQKRLSRFPRFRYGGERSLYAEFTSSFEQHHDNTRP